MVAWRLNLWRPILTIKIVTETVNWKSSTLNARWCRMIWRKIYWLWIKRSHTFYPRPVLAFGYCRCLRLSVCVCVRQPQACPHHNSSRVQARTTKFEQKMHNNLVKVPIVLGGDWPWPSRSNLTSNSEFTPFWACPHHNSLPIQARITKFGPEVQNSLINIPYVLGGNWPWPSRSNFI